MVVVAWPCHSGTFPSLMSSVLSSLTVALAGPSFLPLPSAKCPLSLLYPPPSLSAASAASNPSFSASWSPRAGVARRISLIPPPCRFLTSLPSLLCPQPPNFNFFFSSCLHSIHLSSVFCPCGKARLSAASCLTLLHLRPPSGPLVDSGVEPVETVSSLTPRLEGPPQTLGCSRGTSVFLPWASFL